MVTEIKNKNWFRRHWIISIFLGLFVIGLIGSIFEEESANTQISDSQNNLQDVTSLSGTKLIKTPDTDSMLISLNGSEIVNGDCSAAKPFSEYGVFLPENCKGVWDTNMANYCELGNRRGENVNNYYCRPERFIDCNTISSLGEIEDIKRYGITKVLRCDGENEQLVDVIVRT